MKLIFTEDSRDKIFQNKFGQVIELPNELNLDRPLFDDIQPVGDVKCVAFSITDIGEDQTGIEFDKDDLWKRIPSTPQGSDPRDAFSKVTSKEEDGGLLPTGKQLRDRRWVSYWRADLTSGSQDKFDAVRSAIALTQSPIFCGTYWYREWHGVEILPVGKNPQNGHAYSIEGWKQINGQPHLIIEAWIGRKVYMPRETFNEALKPYGMQTWVLSTSEINARREKNLIEVIKDVMINLIILLRNLIKEKKAIPVVSEPISAPEPISPQPEPVGSKLLEWAGAIRDYEGTTVGETIYED